MREPSSAWTGTRCRREVASTSLAHICVVSPSPRLLLVRPVAVGDQRKFPTLRVLVSLVLVSFRSVFSGLAAVGT